MSTSETPKRSKKPEIRLKGEHIPIDNWDVVQRARAASLAGRSGMNICVFCSARDLSDDLMAPATDFATMIGEKGHNLVWGATQAGLMEKVAVHAKEAGARLVGVTVNTLAKSASRRADTVLVANSLTMRKEAMMRASDAIVALPGGTGTMDELVTTLEYKKSGAHSKPVIALNIEGFYDGMKYQMDTMSETGTVSSSIGRELVYFADTPEDAMAHIIQPRSGLSSIFSRFQASN